MELRGAALSENK